MTITTNDQDDAIHIGSDESLKGDTFGGLTVAAVLATKKQRQQLVAIGVQDSKKITDIKIQLLAKRVREICPFHHVVNLFPEEYNKYSMTGLLNKHHKECYKIIIDQVKNKQEEHLDQEIIHIVDKYPGCDVGDIAETKAESNYVSVAAASILAREAALAQMKELSQRIGFTVPKGSTHVQDGLQQLFMRTNVEPKDFVKLNFKNVRKALEENRK